MNLSKPREISDKVYRYLQEVSLVSREELIRILESVNVDLEFQSINTHVILRVAAIVEQVKLARKGEKWYRLEDFHEVYPDLSMNELKRSLMEIISEEEVKNELGLPPQKLVHKVILEKYSSHNIYLFAEELFDYLCGE